MEPYQALMGLCGAVATRPCDEFSTKNTTAGSFYALWLLEFLNNTLAARVGSVGLPNATALVIQYLPCEREELNATLWIANSGLCHSILRGNI